MKSIFDRQQVLIGILFLFSHLIFFPNLQSQHNVPLDQWVRDYARDWSREDWIPHVKKYGWTENYDWYLKFRETYKNMNVEVIRSVNDGTNIMAWVSVTAEYHQKLEGEIIIETEPKGQKVRWEEVWSFSVTDGVSNEDWNILIDHTMKLRSVKQKCLPDFFLDE